MESSDAEIISAVLRGETERFEILIQRHQAKVFATARRYARRESDVEDIVQEVFLKAFQKLAGFRGEAPFEHWLMRLAVRVCYDFLRGHQRRRETALADLSESEQGWLERNAVDPRGADESEAGARELVHRVLAQLPPASRLVIQLLEIEDRSVKEIARLTGWSIPLVKVRAFRARREMRGLIEQLLREIAVTPRDKRPSSMYMV
jgi:RNA polymerase sigma-70 factor (ECF subfamily)